MAELWDVITLPQALVVVAAMWAVFRLGEVLVDLVRRRKGLPPRDAFEHCEHCDVVNGLDEQLDKLVALASDSYNVLEDMQASGRRLADTVTPDRFERVVIELGALRRTMGAG